MSRKKIAPKEPEATGFLVADGQGGFKPVTAEQLLEAVSFPITWTGISRNF